MKKITNILFFLALVSLTLVTTELYSSYHARAQDGLIVNTVNSDSEAAAQKFVDQINILKNVRLDRSIFSSVLFRSLVDFSQPLPVEESGRPNPFSPI